MSRNSLKLMKIIFPILILLVTVGLVAAQDDAYEIPEPPPGIDLSLEIGRVGDEVITLGDYVNRLRYERLRYYRAFIDLIEQADEEALNLDDPNNQFASSVRSLVDALADNDAIPGSIYSTMMLERLYHQEAQARGIEVSECEIDQFRVILLGIDQEFSNCELPETYGEVWSAFLDEVSTYSDYSEELIEFSLRSRAEYDAVTEAIGQEAEIDEITAVRTTHIRVQDVATAEEILERLEAGEDFDTLLREYTLDINIEGNQGALGMVATTELGQRFGVAFEQAIRDAEEGAIIGPVEGNLGYHIVEVIDKRPLVNARQIVVETEANAQQVIELLESGADFVEIARRFSIDEESRARGGVLGLEGASALSDAVREGILAAQVGEYVGPFETEDGYSVLEVTSREESAQVNVRHILVETEAEAQEVLDLLEAGDDFGAIAVERSLDPSAAGNQGDTLAIVTDGAKQGLYVPEETLIDFDRVVFRAEEGEILGPIETPNFGVFVIRVEEVGQRLPLDADVELARRLHVEEWQNEQFASDRVNETELWRLYVPLDPLPSEFDPRLVPLDQPLLDANAAYLAENDILDTLSSGEIPVDSE
ncbi:MAG: foldase protein PrsA [Chloroflexota bacterium]